MKSDYESLRFWHSVLNREVRILLGRIGLYHKSGDMKSTIIYTNAGAVPVRETPDEVEAIINAAKEPIKKEA